MELKGHEGWIWCIDYSNDGKFIVSGSEDKEIKLWNANTGQMFGSKKEKK